MPKAAPFLSSFNAGEMSPRMEARVDFDRYQGAFSRGKNLIAQPQGGASFRPGTRYVSGTKTQSAASRLIPFQPTTGTSYMLEFGGTYVRFYRNQAQLAAADVDAPITNGTFATDITGWTNRSTGSATIAFASASLRLTGASDGYAWAEQQLNPTGTPTELVIRFQVTTNTVLGRTITAQLGTATVTSDLYKRDGFGIGWHTITCSPGASDVFVQFINKSATNVFVDNVETLDNAAVELTTPYAAADVSGLRWAQVNDVLYLFHDDYAPYKVKRHGDKSWSFEQVFFEDGPWLGINPDIDLYESNLIKNPAFEGGVHDWTVNAYAEYDGEQSVVFFRWDAAGAGQIIQQVSTVASIKHVLHFQIVGGGKASLLVGTSSGGGEVVASTDYVAGWYSIEFTPGSATIYVTFQWGAGTATAVPGVGGAFMYHTRHNLLEPSATTGSVTVEALGDFTPFASTDVGRLMRFEYPGREPGWGTITAYTDSNTVTVFLHRKLPYTTPCETWRLGAWSDTTGWPHAATFFQQRLMPVRTAAQPQTVWGSQSQDLENFRPDSWIEGAVTVVDTDALNYTLASEEVSTINWIVGARRLLIGSASGQWLVSSRGPTLTPTDFNAEQQVFNETADLAPVKVGNVVIFVERATESAYDLVYSYEVDGLQAADLNLISDHLTAESKIGEIVHQTRPYSLVFMRKEDGTLAAMTYKREQNVVGATSIEIAASSAGAAVVESLAVIRGQAVSGSQVNSSLERSELWLQVRRTINGATTRYIEVMEGFFRGKNRAEYETRSSWLSAQLTAQRSAFYVDAGISYSGVSTTTITGLSHLNGETVKVYGAGVEQADKVVSGGQITAATAATYFVVGLSYSWVYRSLKLPFGSQRGSGVGETKTVNEFILALLDAGPFEYALDHDDNALTFFTATDVLGSSNELFTGEWRGNFEGGFSSDPRLWLKGESPHPWTMLGIVPRTVEHEI